MPRAWREVAGNMVLTLKQTLITKNTKKFYTNYCMPTLHSLGNYFI